MILLNGATGYVGGRLLAELVNAGYRVRLSGPPPGASAPARAGRRGTTNRTSIWNWPPVGSPALESLTMSADYSISLSFGVAPLHGYSLASQPPFTVRRLQRKSQQIAQ